MNILISDKLSPEGVEILKQVKEFKVDVNTGLKPDELKKIISKYHALVVRSGTKVTKEIIDEAKNLKVIGRAGVGLDNVDLASATAKGIMVMNAPGGNTISTAEHTFSMVLALMRNIPQAHASMQKGEWKRSAFMGKEVYGKTLGVIGLGRIGTEVAKRALSFGMKIIAFDPFLSKDKVDQLEIESVTLDDLFSRADIITVHVPLTDDTRHMISEKQFSMVKKGVRIVNCARGGIVDETALVSAIEKEIVAGAAFDVFESEPFDSSNVLLKSDKIIFTPHLGASTKEAQVNVSIEIAECVRDALLDKGIKNAANFPSLEPEAMKILMPWVNLGERLGLFLGQLIDSSIKEIILSYSGFFTPNDIAPISMSLVNGLLKPILQDTVNFVNAISIAKGRGIKITEQRLSEESDFANLVSLEVKTAQGIRSIAGTLFADKEPRIVKLDNMYLEAVPKGFMLLTSNVDKPGIIGSLGTLLGKRGVNIACMAFGRTTPGGQAVSIINIDSRVSEEILAEIRSVKDINSVKLLKL